MKASFALALAFLAGCAGGAEERSVTKSVPAAGAGVPRPTVDRFDEGRAFAFVRRQVALGPRPAGSRASRTLARMLRARLPRGRYQRVPGGLRNVVGDVPGRQPRRVIVVGAHYDTKDLRGFVGANDGASATAAVVELAASLRPRSIAPTVVFILFDGEESPAGTPDHQFLAKGLRGSKVAARAFRHAEAMVLLDLIGDRDLSIPRERLSNARLWARLRAAAIRVGVGRVFPRQTFSGVLDDHVPFLRAGVPAIDVIDFTFPCWHRRCDTLDKVSPRSLDAVGETVLELLHGL